MKLETKEKLKTPLRQIRYHTWILTERARGLNLTSTVSTDELGLPSERCVGYQATTPRMKRLLKQLNIPEGASIVDLGCGKGKAMTYMAYFPFKRIIGVEISPELVEIARKNFARLGLDRCEVVLADAENYSIPDDVSYLFMFNPFSQTVLKGVMRNILSSLERNERKFTIIYLYAVHCDVIEESGVFQENMDWKQYKVYTNR